MARKDVNENVIAFFDKLSKIKGSFGVLRDENGDIVKVHMYKADPIKLDSKGTVTELEISISSKETDDDALLRKLFNLTKDSSG
jgi:hypothetical protein